MYNRYKGQKQLFEFAGFHVDLIPKWITNEKINFIKNIFKN